MLLLDLASGARRRLLDDPPAALGLRRGGERGEPPVREPSGAAQFRVGRPAHPHVEAARGRFRQHAQPLVVEPRAVVGDLVLGPEPAQQRQRLLEERGALLPPHPERLLLARVPLPEPERGQQPPARDHVQRGQLLGEDRGGAPRQRHHGGAELDPGRQRRRVGHRHHGVQHGPGDPLGHPEGVEPLAFEAAREGGQRVRPERGRGGGPCRCE
ncbi:hypothetical protein LUX33_10425 [Actinomadura madurae]|nr:hypothetical protein [Actinomadura madurae]MCP9948789.1 hypothetical protein [Actinomadura madurae]